MARNLFVESLHHTPIEKQETEIVERKGIGHPDSLADGISESVSRALCQMYLKRVNPPQILHHNTDETHVVGGQAKPKFGGGEVLEPATVILVGRATTDVNGERLPYRKTAVRAAEDYLAKVCSNLDVSSDVTFDCRIGKGSVDLRGLYETRRRLSNDTSFGVSFAPFSETETLVLETERYINGSMKKELPAVGEDVKVMACRTGDRVRLTVAAAVVDKFVRDKGEYEEVIQAVKENVHRLASKKLAQMHSKREVVVDVNTGDDYGRDIFYLTVTGLSMENGDDGSVGRGNRVNGLITPYRPMSLEAAAGKNPVTHVGKLYNTLAYQIAHAAVKETSDLVKEIHVRIVSQIGKPIDQPQAATAQVVTVEGVPLSKVKKDIERVIDGHLDKIDGLTDGFVRGDFPVF